MGIPRWGLHRGSNAKEVGRAGRIKLYSGHEHQLNPLPFPI